MGTVLPRYLQKVGTDLIADVFLLPVCLHNLLPLVSNLDLHSLATVLFVLDSCISELMARITQLRNKTIRIIVE